jgi:GntR family transcriptional repressor for pyruvate dehydrogenase complex
MTEVFDFSLQRDKLSEQVAEQIQEWILADSLKPGDKLPPERELAERIGVSRAVVREAIGALSIQGLVKVKPGCGTYVQALNVQDAAASIELYLKLRQTPQSFRDIYEVRSMLEVEAAGLAAHRATEADRAALESALDDMVAHHDDPGRYVASDLAFHASLVAATHNELFSVLFGPLASRMQEIVQISFREPGAVSGGLTHHRNILESIEQRDPERARQAMRDHLKHAQALVEDVLAKLASTRDEEADSAEDP